MKFGITYAIVSGRQPLEQMFGESVEQIQLAESCGFEYAFVSEHHFLGNMFSSPLVALAYIAARTTKIKLGTGVLLMPLHDPIRVAEDTAVLDVISGGRALLGLGQGYRPEEFAGFHKDLKQRRALMREGATLVRRLWTQDKVSFQGEHNRLNDISLAPRPLQKPSPPIWIGAKVKGAVELAAEIGDGWFADPITSLDIIEKNKVHWLAKLQAEGKKIEDQALAYYREFHVAETEQRAWDIGGKAIVGEYHGYRKLNHLTDQQGKPIPAERADLVEPLVKERCTIGSPESCIDELSAIKSRIDPTHFVLKMKYGGVPAETVKSSIRLAAERVLPAL